MKFLVLTTSFPRYPNDYIAPFLLELFQEIKNKKHDVTILSPQMKGLPKFQKMNELDVYRINYSKDYKKQVLGDGFLAERLKESNLNKFNLFRFLLKTLKKALNIHKKKNFNVINTQWVFPSGLLGLILKYLINRPLIITIHGAGIFLAKKYAFLKPFIKLTLKKADLIIFNSSNTRLETLKIQKKIKKGLIIHPGIKIDRFKNIKEPKLDKRQLFENHQIILSIGRLIERKGFEFLIKAMKEIIKSHDRVRLVIIGTGPLEKKLKSLVNRLELQQCVHFFGEVKGEFIPYFYNKSKLFVLPSIIDKQGDTEGLGIVILEAMASETPVIGTNVGGIKDLIEDGHDGILIKQKDPINLANAIKKILTDDEFTEKIRKNSFQKVKDQFKWSEIASKTIKSYYEVIK